MKLIFALILSVFATIATGQMVTTVYVKMNPGDLPSDYTPTAAPAMTLPKKQSLTINVPASLDNATDSLAVVAIANAIKDSIDLNYLVQDFRIDTSLASTGQILITDINRQYDAFEIRYSKCG